MEKVCFNLLRSTQTALQSAGPLEAESWKGTTHTLLAPNSSRDFCAMPRQRPKRATTKAAAATQALRMSQYIPAAKTLSFAREPGLKPGALVWMINFFGAPNSPRAFSLPAYIAVSHHASHGRSWVIRGAMTGRIVSRILIKNKHTYRWAVSRSLTWNSSRTARNCSWVSFDQPAIG